MHVLWVVMSSVVVTYECNQLLGKTRVRCALSRTLNSRSLTRSLRRCYAPSLQCILTFGSSGTRLQIMSRHARNCHRLASLVVHGATAGTTSDAAGDITSLSTREATHAIAALCCANLIVGRDYASGRLSV